MAQVSDFNYELPKELIAQEPLAERSASRMLVISRQEASFRDDVFANFDKYIRGGDCLVLNNTRVFPARLRGRRNSPAGAAVEFLLLKALNDDETVWSALARPAKRVRTGDWVTFGDDLSAEILSEGEFGERVVRFPSTAPVSELLERKGEMPLPPYIHRKTSFQDRERYQTVFAEKRGSAAAPTAGLHFTPEMLVRCRQSGAEIAYITLHVGLGTFAPLRQKNLEEIELHEEYFEISESNVSVVRQAKRRFCIGTTSVRAIETVFLRGSLSAMRGETNVFIYPGFHFRGTGALLTNFHLPQSSLLMLVCAFAGRELTLAAYRHAIEQKYRFYSYGDCMIIV